MEFGLVTQLVLGAAAVGAFFLYRSRRNRPQAPDVRRDAQRRDVYRALASMEVKASPRKPPRS